MRLSSGDDTLNIGAAGQPDQRAVFQGATLFDGQGGANTLNALNAFYARPPIIRNFA